MNMKRILLLHPNFPAQFKNLSAILGTNKQIDVKFLCMTNYASQLKGVKSLKIKGNRGQTAMEELKMNELKNMQFRAESYRLAFKVLRESGWNPDIVIGHTGWGCGIHVKDIWSECLFIGYSEWWFSLNSEFANSAKLDPYMGIKESQEIGLLRRNQYMALELCNSDKIVTPTDYQKRQLPDLLRRNCIVINDGVDAKFFQTKSISNNKNPVVTYGTRGMEPMRCFRQFIQSIPDILRMIPSACIEILGEDKICYGGLPPNKNQSWAEWAKQYLREAGVENKVIWKGRMNYFDYRDWLQGSWCHVYLSQPFVASWSLLEALMTGIPIVANEVSPIQEFTAQANGVCMTKTMHPGDIASSVMSSMTNPKNNELRFERYDRHNTLKILDISKAIQQWEHVTGLELHTTI